MLVNALSLTTPAVARVSLLYRVGHVRLAVIKLSTLRDGKHGSLVIVRNERSKETLTMKCPRCGATLVAKPVPGAKQFPRRLECPEHGWQQEKPGNSHPEFVGLQAIQSSRSPIQVPSHSNQPHLFSYGTPHSRCTDRKRVV